MNYGTPKTVGATAVTGFAALSLGGQIGIIAVSLAGILLIALLIRNLWRRHKDLGE